MTVDRTAKGDKNLTASSSIALKYISYFKEKHNQFIWFLYLIGNSLTVSALGGTAAIPHGVDDGLMNYCVPVGEGSVAKVIIKHGDTAYY